MAVESKDLKFGQSTMGMVPDGQKENSKARVESFEELFTFISGDRLCLKTGILRFSPCGHLHVVSTCRLLRALSNQSGCLPRATSIPKRRKPNIRNYTSSCPPCPLEWSTQ